MTPKQILIVEDEIIVAQDLQQSLQRLGYLVPVIASSGEKAIRHVAELHPDLVLMDITLKGSLDGVEVAERIRDQFDIPVVYLTAHADKKTLQRAKITGPLGYLVKPFEERELHTTIEMALHRHEIERRLKESEQWLATTLRCIGEGVIATDARGYIKFINPIAEGLTGWRREQALGHVLKAVFNVTHARQQNGVEELTPAARQEASTEQTILIAKDGTETLIDYSVAPIQDDKGIPFGVVLVFRDITEQKLAERERIKLMAELQTASAKVKTLTGLLPICASCKKIRDDQGYWHQIEAYIRDHSEANFSHSLCFDCEKKLRPDSAAEGAS